MSRLPAFKNKKKKRKLAHSPRCSLTRDKDFAGTCNWCLHFAFIVYLSFETRRYTWTSMKVISAAMLTGDAIPRVAANTSGWNFARRTREITDL